MSSLRSSDCPRVGKLFGGCRFEPRYDKGPSPMGETTGAAGGVIALAETMKPVTYVKDVCVRCGAERTR